MLEDHVNQSNKYVYYEELDKFDLGFRLGVRMMLDILTDENE